MAVVNFALSSWTAARVVPCALQRRCYRMWDVAYCKSNSRTPASLHADADLATWILRHAQGSLHSSLHTASFTSRPRSCIFDIEAVIQTFANVQSLRPTRPFAAKSTGGV
jgi:hypothetical protein